MAKILNKEPAVYKKEQDNFLKELRKFHESKGTSYKHVPQINGKEIDLYLLYWLVTAQGGWERVNNKNGWDDLLESFDLPASTCNGSLALKQTYLRYLDTYEKYYFLGEEEEDESNPYFDEEDSRARRERQRRIVQNVPTTYNESQHRVTDNLRSHYGLSTDLYQKTDYDRLGLSLLSPLPNEQDFAINVCTLLSNEGRHTLKLGKCPRLLDILLAHAGVFNHHNLRDYVSDNYQTVRNYDQIRFWRDVCKEKNVLHLVYDERNFYPKNENAIDRPNSDPLSDDIEELTGKERIAAVKARAAAELEEEEADELFCSGRQNGTKELTGQRVLQVATIIRNLSFEEDNSPVLAKNLTCLRFILLCVNSSWANLNQMGFDILSNIACNVQLEEPSEDAVTDLLLSTLSRCIGAPDRFQVISSLDVLSKLCGQETNEDFIQRLLDGAVYSRLVEYLSLHDIHLLITVLECLYSLTSLGEVPCTALVKTHSALELLVSLVTVEAQSYGPKACILMRVVETVPGTTTVGAPATTQAPVQTTAVVAGAAAGSTTVTRVAPALPTQPLPQPQVSNILPRHPVPITRPTVPVVAAAAASSPAPAAAAIGAPRPQGPPGSQQVQLRVSNDEPHRAFCLSWLKATYEPSPGKTIEQNIMYKQYLASMHRMGRKEVISAQHYALCIRTLFGGSTGPNKKQVGDKVENHYTGIQVREHPLPLKLTPAQAAAAQEASRQQQQQQQVQAQQPVQNGVTQVVQQSQQQQPGVIQQQVVQAGQKIVTAQPGGQQIIVNAQGQQVIGGQLIQGGVVQQVQPAKVMLNAQGQQIIVNNSNQQVIQLNPSNNVVTSGGQLIVNQAGQVVQQRIVNSHGQIVAQGMVHGQVIASGMQNRVQVQPAPAVAAPATGTNNSQQIPLGQVIQRIIHPGGRIEEKIVQATPVSGHPGQMMIQTPGGGQQIVQTQPATGQPAGQVIQLQQQQPQQQQIVVNSNAGVQVSSGGQIITSSGGQLITSSGTVGQTQVVRTVSVPVQQQQQQQQQLNQAQRQYTNEEMMDNGLSPLDGILPKDPKFGVLDGDMVNELLSEKSENSLENIVMNGVVNHDNSKMNGDVTGGKRMLGEYNDNSPAKKQALDGAGVVVTNGGHGNGSLNGGGLRTPVSASGQLVQNSQGQMMILKTSSASGGVVLQPAGGQGQGHVIMGQQLQQGPGSDKIVFLQQSDGKQQIVRQGIAGAGHQTVVRVSAPVAQVAPAPADHLPQVDGADDGQPDTDNTIAQVDGTIVEPVSSTQSDQQQPQQQEQNVVTLSQQSVIQRPVTVQSSPNVTVSQSSAETSGSSPSPPPVQVKIDTQKPFLCEWAGCMKSYKTPKEVENHAIAVHCPLGSDDIACKWARCDNMKRKRFSLMTHLQDRHCHPQLMKLMAVRRVQIAQTGKSEVPLPPAPPPHPGYAPNAALHAIKRHAVEFANPKENAMRDEKEGPVTKSIRLTASLILKNLVIYSSLGRSRLRAYESHLSTVALSNVESSRTVSQILFEMANVTDFA